MVLQGLVGLVARQVLVDHLEKLDHLVPKVKRVHKALQEVGVKKESVVNLVLSEIEANVEKEDFLEHLVHKGRKENWENQEQEDPPDSLEIEVQWVSEVHKDHLEMQDHRVSLEKKVCEDHKVSKDLVVIQEHLVQLVLLVKLEEEVKEEITGRLVKLVIKEDGVQLVNPDHQEHLDLQDQKEQQELVV